MVPNATRHVAPQLYDEKMQPKESGIVPPRAIGFIIGWTVFTIGIFCALLFVAKSRRRNARTSIPSSSTRRPSRHLPEQGRLRQPIYVPERNFFTVVAQLSMTASSIGHSQPVPFAIVVLGSSRNVQYLSIDLPTESALGAESLLPATSADAGDLA